MRRAVYCIQLTRAISPGEVATLAHEVADYSVERRALEVQGLALPAGTLLTSTESPEILSSPRHYISTKLFLGTEALQQTTHEGADMTSSRRILHSIF